MSKDGRQWNALNGGEPVLISKLGEKGVRDPYILRSHDGKPATWCLVPDQYGKGKGYQPFVTDNLAGGQFKPAPDFTFPFLFRHGSILPLNAAEYSRLETALGKPGSVK